MLRTVSLEDQASTADFPGDLPPVGDAAPQPSEAAPSSAPTFAIAATFTAEPVEPSLNYWLQQFSFLMSVRFAPFNQIFQALLDPTSALNQNNGGINALLIRPKDWVEATEQQKNGFTAEDWRQKLTASADEFIAAIKSASQNTIPLIVALCPADAGDEASLAAVFTESETRIASALVNVPGVYVLTPDAIQRLYPVTKVFDPRSDLLGSIPYTPLFFTALGTMLARTALAIHRPPYKVIVLDCDNTLWRGVCGEGGVSAVSIDGSFRALQQFVLARADEGTLLCLCSKNVEQDVFDIFDNHPDMVLERDRLVGWRINWNAKSQNLRELAAELNLGIDSFVFLDDNPIECAEVRANAPGVLTLQIPADPAQIPTFLEHIWPLDQLTVSDQDRRRTTQYLQNAQRESIRRESAGLSDFLSRLQLEVDIHPASDAEMPRAAQLTQRTNQFNASTIRRSEPELHHFLRDGSHRCVVVHVKDRFGDYGLVGEMILRPDAIALVLDTLLLSCRVLGRGVEHQLIAYAGRMAQELELPRLDILFTPTAKNRPMLDFLQSIAAEHGVTQPDGSTVYKLPAAVAAAVKARVASAPVLDDAAERSTPDESVPAAGQLFRVQLHALYERIALDLNAPAAILEAINSDARNARIAANDSATVIAPRNEDEQKMLDIWRRVLNIEQIGVTDDYFKLGGTSILAVRLVLEAERVFGKPLPIAALLRAPTIELLTRELRSNIDDSKLAMVTLREGHIQPPLFILPGTAGHAMAFRQFAQLMEIDHPVVGMEMRPELDHNRRPRSMEQIAAEFIERMTIINPTGPFLLSGWSFGGALAFEAGRQLHAAGREVALVLLFDTYGPNYPRILPRNERVKAHLKNIWTLSPAQKAAYLASRALATGRLIRTRWRRMTGWREADLLGYDDPRTGEMVALNDAAWAAYVPKPLPVKLTLIRASDRDARVGVSYEDPYNGWQPFVGNGIEVIPLEAGHLSLFEPPAVEQVAAAVTQCVQTACSTRIPTR
jgi:FkbH-like protein